jgi:hypothetical protein
MRATRTMRIAVAGLAMVGLLAACGDDDDEEASGSASTASEDAGGDTAAFCDGYLGLNAGEPTAEKIREVAADAPDAAKEPLEAIATGFEDEGEEYTDGPEFGKNYEAVTKVVVDECTEETIEVTAAEYKFTGIPEELPAGIVGATFENTGGEMHEIVVLHKKDGVTESFQDILAKGEEEAQKLVDVSFGAFGEPGSKSTAAFDMREAGEYAAVCFIPVGSTPDAGEEVDGPPHFTQGMITEFTVG